MTVSDHPERVRAAARGDQAERLVGIALDLAMLVRDEGPDAIGSFLGRLTRGDRDRLLIVLAAMVPVEIPEDQLLGWVTWDEHGRPLEGVTPVLPIFTDGDGSGEDGDEHGTYAAYARHMRAGQRSRDLLEACGCARAAREYYQERHARRKQERAEAVDAAA